MESGIKELVANTEIDWTEENTLEIRVWDRDAQRAADIANEYVELLNKRSLEIQTQEAKNNRLFIEQRLVQNKKDLFEAEQIFKDYQKKTGMVVIYDPTSSGTASLAEIYAQKARKEIEIGILKHTTKPGSSVYSQAEIELNSINGEINKFPDIGVESLRLYRNVAIQQKILEYMTPMFEEAKVNEHKDVPVAYVLDKAISGEKPDRPKRSYLIGISAFLGLIIGFLIIIWKEYVSHLRERFPEQYARLNQMKHLFSKRM
jgi:uncharacterized protein involved in exopolysaccharide biosynthesis